MATALKEEPQLATDEIEIIDNQEACLEALEQYRKAQEQYKELKETRKEIADLVKTKTQAKTKLKELLPTGGAVQHFRFGVFRLTLTPPDEPETTRTVANKASLKIEIRD